MLALIVDIRIDSDCREQFLAAIKSQAKSSLENEPGCKQFDICEDVEDPVHFVLYEIYTDEDAFHAHAKTEYFARWSEARTRFVTQLVRTLTKIVD